MMAGSVVRTIPAGQHDWIQFELRSLGTVRTSGVGTNWIQFEYADLHLHTNFSDGTYTPEELAALSQAPASVDGAAVALQRRFPEGWRMADSTPRVTSAGIR